MLGANNALQNASAEGDTRTLSFHHVHTGEDITITFKRNGRYDDAALKKLDWFMRDWRKEKSTRMDPHLFDLLWEAYREVGATQPIDVVCGYRSPETNSMLRRRSNGVAQFSQHINGQAMDFFIPGVPLEKIREVGLRLQRGGVGFYPTSGSPFVHMDTGTIRHWPRMTHDQLVKVFPDGRTVHVPSDGQPLRGYALALADVERRGGRPSETSLEAAREAGVVSASRTRNFFARLFGRGKDADEVERRYHCHFSHHHHNKRHACTRGRCQRDPTETQGGEPWKPSCRCRLRGLASTLVASAETKPSSVGAVAVKPASHSFVTASLGSQSVRQPRLLARRDTERPGSAGRRNGVDEVSDCEPRSGEHRNDRARLCRRTWVSETGQRNRVQWARARCSNRRNSSEAAVCRRRAIRRSWRSCTNGGERRPGDQQPLAARGHAHTERNIHMSATRIGAVDMRPLQELIYKPSQSLALSFSRDPNLGLVASRFSGPAIVFLATTTFTTQATAAFAMHTTAFR